MGVYALLLMSWLLEGCGVSKGIPKMGRGEAIGASVSTSSLSTGWNGPYAVDSAAMGAANLVKTDGNGGANAPFCENTAEGAGFAGSGCVQQAALVWSDSRFLVGFPQKLTTTTYTADGAAYAFHNVLAAMSSLTTFLFGTFSDGLLGFLNTIGSPNQVVRYISYAKLSSGKVVAVYALTDNNSVTVNTNTQVYGSVYNPATDSWGSMTRLSTGASATLSFLENASLDIRWDDYTAAAPAGGMAGQYCRPRVAASGNRAMAVFCERRTISTDAAAYVRYAIYNGSSWIYENAVASRSSALLAATGSAANGMNEDSNGAGTDLRTTFHPGMARRVPVPAFVPNGLFVAESGDNHVHAVYPMPVVDTTLAAVDFGYGDGAGAVPTGSVLLNNGDNALTGPSAVNSDGTRLFVAESAANTVKIWSTIPYGAPAANGTPTLTLTNGGAGITAPTSVFSDGIKLAVANAGAADNVLIWYGVPGTNTAPVSGSTGATISGFTDPEQVVIVGTKLIVADAGANQVLIWNNVPTVDETVGGATYNVRIHATTAANFTNPRAVFSDGVRLFVGATSGGLARLFIWNKIPTSALVDLDTDSADVVIRLDELTPTALGNLKNIGTDGLRLFVSDGTSTQISIWNMIPLEHRTYDLVVDGFAAADVAFSWSRFVAPALTGWPVTTGAYSTYSVNPKTTDTLTLVFRGLTATISSLVGDPFGTDRCSAISNIVNQINQNTTVQAMNMEAQLPSAWEGPACDDTVRGQGQFFWLTQNPDFQAADGVDTSTASQLSNSSATATAALRPEDIRLTIGDSTAADGHVVRFFGHGNSVDKIEAFQPGVSLYATGNFINSAQYVVGRMSDDSGSPAANGFPVLPANGQASNPESTTQAIRPVDLSAASFVEVAGTGSGNFQVLQGARALAQPYYQLTCGGMNDRSAAATDITAGCGVAGAPGFTAATAPTNLDLIPSELSFPRVLYGFRFNGTDWQRRYTGAGAIPHPYFIGPTQPYAVDYLTRTVQGIPLGMRWPRMVTSQSGKGLLFFYGRNGQRPFNSISSAAYRASTSYDQSSEVSVANALWMATYDDLTGFSAASVISPDPEPDATAAYRASTSSVATDLDVCETAQPFAITVASACLVGEDPYSVIAAGAGNTVDKFCSASGDTTRDCVTANTYNHDVAPIPAAMNASGYAVVGMHRKDNCSSYQGIGFYVALYGPTTGLASFTRIDSNSSRSCTESEQTATMGGAVAIDDSGNVAAVWEERSALSASGANHIYYRYYSASTASWGDVTQIDSSTITAYGNTAFTYAPEAPMMPNVAFGDGGKIVVTWSGPACSTATSSTCRRTQMVKIYSP